MRNQSWDLLAVIGVAFLALAAGALSGAGSNPLLVVVTLPLVLFIPGYALSAALLPHGRLGLAERLALSLGLSVAIAALGGLLLNFLPAGLTAGSWRILLFGMTLVAAAYAHWGRQQDGLAGPGRLVTRISMREAALLSSAALLIGLALGLGAIGVGPVAGDARGQEPFTQFWAIPARSGEQYVVKVGVHNYELERVPYRVTLESGDYLLAEWPQVSLASGEQWQAQATLPGNLAGVVIHANAYWGSEQVPYRQVRLTFDAQSESAR